MHQVGNQPRFTLLFSDFNQAWSFKTDFFIKVSGIKIHGNPSPGSRSDTYGRTEKGYGYYEANGHFSLMCEHA